MSRLNERNLRKAADAAWERGSKDLSQDLHQAAREEEQRKRDMSQYLEDHLIQDYLNRVDEAVAIYSKAREENNYTMISFALGGLNAGSQLIFARNAQIDLGGP